MGHFSKSKAKLQGPRKRVLSDGQGARKRKRSHTRQGSARHLRSLRASQ